MKLQTFKQKDVLYTLILFVTACALRLVNLGYSDYAEYRLVSIVGGIGSCSKNSFGCGVPNKERLRRGGRRRFN